MEVEVVSVVIIVAVIIFLAVIGIVGHLGEKKTKTATKPKVSSSGQLSDALKTTNSLNINQMRITVPLSAAIEDVSYSWNGSSKSADLTSPYLLQINNQFNPASCRVLSNHGSFPAYVFAKIVNKDNTGNGTPFAALGKPGGPVSEASIKGQDFYLYSTLQCPTPSAAFNYQFLPYLNTLEVKFPSSISY